MQKFLFFVILMFSMSSAWASAEEKGAQPLQKKSEVKGTASEQEKDVAKLKEIVVTTVPVVNPVTPVVTPFATQRNVVTEEQIKEQSSTDFQSSLRDVPGVMFQSRNLMGAQTSHSLYIRGRGASHPSSDFAILYDGAPRFGALFGQVYGDSMALPTIGSIEIFKSPQPSEFGSGYALVNVVPKYMKQEGKEVVFDLSGGNFSTFVQSLSGGVKNGHYDIYVSQSWASTDGHVDRSRAQQQSYYANVGYQLSDNWTLRFLANYVAGQTVAPLPDPKPAPNNGVSWPMAERFDTNTVFSTLTLSNSYDNASGWLKVYLNETDFDLLQELTNGARFAGGSGGLWSRQNVVLYGLRLREKIKPWRGGEIIVGSDFDLTEMKNTQRTYSGLAVPGINGGRAVRIWEFPQTRIISPYSAVSHMFGSQAEFHVIPSAGYRYLHHNEFESASSYQAGLVVGYAHTDLIINYSRGVNYPSPIVVMNMVPTHAPVANASEIWKKIKPETVDHYEIGVTHSWPQKASLGATAFYDKGKDRYLAYMFGAIPVQFNDPIGKYEIRGLELAGTLTPVKKLELFAGATLMEAKAKGSDGIERDRMPYTPSFQLQAGINWSFLESFRLRMDMQYLQDVYAGTNMRSGSFNFGQLTESNKLENFAIFNARLGYRFDYKPMRVSDSELYFAVNNLFNRYYEYARGYGMPGITAFAGVSLKFK